MGQRLATTSANTRAIVGDRIQTAMSARATPESLKRHARNINPTETMIATSAAVKAALRRIGFSEPISFDSGLTWNRAMRAAQRVRIARAPVAAILFR